MRVLAPSLPLPCLAIIMDGSGADLSVKVPKKAQKKIGQLDNCGYPDLSVALLCFFLA